MRSLGATSTLPTASTKTSNFSASGSNALYNMDATSNSVTGTLPVATLASILYFRRIDSTANLCKIVGAGADTINGGAFIYIFDQWDSLILISDGVSEWSIL